MEVLSSLVQHTGGQDTDQWIVFMIGDNEMEMLLT